MDEGQILKAMEAVEAAIELGELVDSETAALERIYAASAVINVALYEMLQNARAEDCRVARIRAAEAA